MSRLLIGGAIALFMALTPALAEDAPASGANTTPAAKEKNATPPSAVEDSDAGKTGGGGGAGGAGWRWSWSRWRGWCRRGWWRSWRWRWVNSPDLAKGVDFGSAP